MKIYLLKDKGTGFVATVRAESRLEARDQVVREKGWKEEDVILVEERPDPTIS